MLCLTKEVLPKSILLIAKILAYSVMSSQASFCSTSLHSSNPVRSILSSTSFWPSFFIFFMVSPLFPSSPVGLGTSNTRFIPADVISPTVVCFGRVTCLALWFYRHISILPFSGLNYPYDLTMAMCLEQPKTGSTTTFKEFECVHHTCYQCDHQWCNKNFPHSHITETFDNNYFETMVLRWTCLQVSPAFYSSFLVIIATNWSLTCMLYCTGTLSPYLWFATTEKSTSSL